MAIRSKHSAFSTRHTVSSSEFPVFLTAVVIPAHVQLVGLRGLRGFGISVCPVCPFSFGGRLASHAEGKECLCLCVVCVSALGFNSRHSDQAKLKSNPAGTSTVAPKPQPTNPGLAGSKPQTFQTACSFQARKTIANIRRALCFCVPHCLFYTPLSLLCSTPDPAFATQRVLFNPPNGLGFRVPPPLSMFS